MSVAAFDLKDDPRPVLVTGGCGFLGSNLVRELAARGRNVIALDNFSRSGARENVEWLTARCGNRLSIEAADIRDAEALRGPVAGAAAIMHLAGQVAVTTSMADPLQDFEINLRGTVNLLETVRLHNPRAPIVFASTNKVYGDLGDLPFTATDDRYEPTGLMARRGINESRPLDFHTPYGCSKGSADQYILDYCRSFGIPTVVFRMSCI